MIGAILDTIAEAWRFLVRHPLRSILAAIGVAIALGAIVAVLAAEQSWQETTIREFNRLGADLIDIRLPYSQADLRKLRRQQLQPEDAEAIRQQCPAVKFVGFAVHPGYTDIRIGRQHASVNLNLISPDYLRVQEWATVLRAGLAAPTQEGCWLSPMAATKLLGENFRSQLPAQLRVSGRLLALNGIVEVPAFTDDGAEGIVFLPWQSRKPASSAWVDIHARAPEIRRAAAQINAVLAKRLGAKEYLPLASGPWYAAEHVIAQRRTLRLFIGVTLICVLLVSVLGVMSNLLVNLEEQVREIALRRALGAQTTRIMAEVLVESGLISITGGVIGIALAGGSLQLVKRLLFAPGMATGGRLPHEAFALHLSWQALAVGAGACLGAALMAGWVPASAAARLEPSQALAVAPSRRFFPGRLLATSQAAVGVCAALVLLSLFAGLARKSLSDLRHLSKVDSIMAYRLAISRPGQARSRYNATSNLKDLSNKFQEVCASQSAMAVLRKDCRGTAAVSRYWNGGAGVKRGRIVMQAPVLGVDSGIANPGRGEEGVSLSLGRALMDSDNATRAKVCVIGEGVRSALFGIENPLGKSVRVAGVSYTVVGVVAHSWSMTDKETGVTISSNNDVILPIDARPQSLGGGFQLVFTIADPSQAKAAEGIIQTAFRAAGSLPADYQLLFFNNAESYAQFKQISRDISLRAVLIGSAGLWVALVGLVNMLFASLQTRVREIGLLRALGATREAIVFSTSMEGLSISFVGCIPGVALALGLTTLLGRATDVPVWIPPTWAVIVTVCMAGAGSLAAFLPAAQAAYVNPSDALRHE